MVETGLERILKEEGVDAAAIVQWCASVQQARFDGQVLGSTRYLEVFYETFIQHPVTEWHKIMSFLGRTPTGSGDNFLRENVKAGNAKKWLNSIPFRFFS